MFPQLSNSKQIFDPCGGLPAANLDRVLAFYSPYMDFVFDIATLTGILTKKKAGSGGATSVQIGASSSGTACTGPADTHDSVLVGGYSVG